MEIIFASTGVECVAAPSRGVIFLDPTLDYESAVEAIHASLPSVHVDAIHHWVEKAMPSAVPLGRRARAVAVDQRALRRSGFRMALACLVLIALGAGSMWGFQWLHERYVDNVFDHPAFKELAVGRGWDCDRSMSHPSSATCVTQDGVTIHAVATQAERVTQYTLAYERDGSPYLARLVEWPTPEDKPRFIKYEAMLVDGLHPNLIEGPTWMLYGNDGERIERWARELRRPHGI